MRGGGRVEGGEHALAALVEVTAGALRALALDALGARAVLAGEEALGQRVVRQAAEVVAAADVGQAVLIVALDEVVVGLEGDRGARAPRALASRAASRRAGETFEAATWRTLPSRASSSSAPIVSSGGVTSSSRWV